MVVSMIRKTFFWLARLGLLAIVLAATPANAAIDLLEPEDPEDIAFGEVGENDFRLSDMGPNGNTDYSAISPKVAYNSTDNQYLVVWYGEDNSDGMVVGEFEIFGQIINAMTGAEIGNDFRISAMGADGNTTTQATNPDIAYNSTNNQYLVVWSGSATAGKTEIWGQRINAANGSKIGTAFRIGSMGAAGNTSYDAYTPAVIWNSTDNEYMVVWSGDDVTRGTADEEYEIFGQRLEADTGSLIGGNFRISEMGPDLNAAYDAYSPDIAYNSVANNYWVVWAADKNTDGMIDEEFEIFIQRLVGSTGTETGPKDYRISSMGSAGNASWDASEPQAACTTQLNECIFSWHGDHNTNGQVDDEFEIFINRVGGLTDDSLTIYGQSRISAMGGYGNGLHEGFSPEIVYNPNANEYIVAWYGIGLVRTFYQSEVFVQRINGTTDAEIGNEIAISDMGPDSVDTLTAQSAALAFNSINLEYLVVWHGDDNIAPLVNEELEVFGQRLAAADFFEVMLPFVFR